MGNRIFSFESVNTKVLINTVTSQLWEKTTNVCLQTGYNITSVVFLTKIKQTQTGDHFTKQMCEQLSPVHGFDSKK